jgi:hypothetical protein
MNELLREVISYILEKGESERKTREVGETWQTDSGKWSAKSKDRTQGGFASREAAEAWLSGTGKAPGDTGDTNKNQPAAEKGTSSVQTQPKTGPKNYTSALSAPSQKSASGGTVYDTPVKTPGGNEVNAIFKPEDIEKIVTSVNKEIDSKAAADDSLPDQIDLDAHLDRQLPNSNDDYYAKRKIRNPQRISDETRRELREAGVPDSHIDMIERAINTETDGDNPPFSEIAGGPVGMGKPPSQAGELMAMTFMAVSKDKRAGVASVIEGLISSTGLKKPTLDGSWVEAGLNQSEAFDSMMDSRYGAGNWSVETTAWDTKDDMDAIGLSPENKGFSTDVAVRVRLKSGEAKVARLSLKKDGTVFLLNGTTNDIVDFAFSGLSDGEGRDAAKAAKDIDRLLPLVDKDVAAKEELAKLLGVDPTTSKVKLKAIARERRIELENKAVDSIPDEKTRERVRTIRDFPQRQHSSVVEMGSSVASVTSTPNKENVIQAAKNNEWSESEAKMAVKVHTILRKLGPGVSEAEITDALESAGIKGRPRDKFRKALLFAAQLEATRNEDMKTQLDAHMELTTACANAAIDSVMDDPSVMQGLMVKLEETFPVRVIAQGQESMCLGGVPVSRETCEVMFGTSNPDEIQKGLKIVTQPGSPPKRILMYTSEGTNGKEIPIALVRPREKGVGYRGSVGLEFQSTKEFECAAAKANVEAKQNNSANAKIVKKCEKRSTKGKK